MPTTRGMAEKRYHGRGGSSRRGCAGATSVAGIVTRPGRSGGQIASAPCAHRIGFCRSVSSGTKLAACAVMIQPSSIAAAAKPMVASIRAEKMRRIRNTVITHSGLLVLLLRTPAAGIALLQPPEGRRDTQGCRADLGAQRRQDGRA